MTTQGPNLDFLSALRTPGKGAQPSSSDGRTSLEFKENQFSGLLIERLNEVEKLNRGPAFLSPFPERPEPPPKPRESHRDRADRDNVSQPESPANGENLPSRVESTRQDVVASARAEDSKSSRTTSNETETKDDQGQTGNVTAADEPATEVTSEDGAVAANSTADAPADDVNSSGETSGVEQSAVGEPDDGIDAETLAGLHNALVAGGSGLKADTEADGESEDESTLLSDLTEVGAEPALSAVKGEQSSALNPNALNPGASANGGRGDGGKPSSHAEMLNAALAQNTSGEGSEEAEVTQQFKDMGSKLPLAGQEATTNIKVPKASLAQAGAELQRMAAIDPAGSDKPVVTNAQGMAVRFITAPPAAQSPYVTNLQMPVQSQEFLQGMAQKLVWFVSEKIQSAQIHVNPPELGPVDMKIQVSKDQAQIQIQSPHAVVREMLEGTAHRLREMMASQGIDLTQFDVGNQEQHTQGGEQSQQEQSGSGNLPGATVEAAPNGETEELGLDQLVDYYV